MDTLQNEAFLRDAVARGEPADFTAREGYNAADKPKISAAFLRRLLLGQERGEDGRKVEPLLPGVRVRGALVEGALDLSDCAGAGGTGLPALALDLCDLPERLDLSGARLARLSIAGSRFRGLWGIGLRVDGDFNFAHAAPAPVEGEGGNNFILMRGARIGGDVVGQAARLAAGDEPHALDLQDAAIAGTLALGAGFRAEGCVWLHGVKLGGGLQCVGGSFSNPEGSALVAVGAEIGGAVLLRAMRSGEHPFDATGEVTFYAAEIGGSLECDGARFSNPGGEAIQATNAIIGGDVLLRALGEQRLQTDGAVSFVGAKIGGDFELNGTNLKHRGRALSLRTARIEGQLDAQDNAIDGVVSFAGARIGRLYDNPDTAWGDPKAKLQIETNEISLDLIGAFDTWPRPLWKARARWLRRNTGSWMDGSRAPFSNQPWRQVAAAFERAGLHGDGRRIRREEQREANKFRRFWQQPFVWLFAEQMFGYGLSVSRATATIAAFWLLGALGAATMQTRGALVATQDPDHAAIACQNFQPALYALDIMLPVLDLGQESGCEPGLLPGGRVDQDRRQAEQIAIADEIGAWSWAKALYAIAGALVTGFALLTYTGVFKPRAEA